MDPRTAVLLFGLDNISVEPRLRIEAAPGNRGGFVVFRSEEPTVTAGVKRSRAGL